MKTLLATLLTITMLTALVGQAQTVQVAPDEVQAVAMVVPLVTNGTASTVSWVNNSDATFIPLSLLQDINRTAGTSTNAMAITYLPRVYGAASNVTYRVGAPTSQIAGAEAVQALTSYPPLRPGDTYIFSSTTAANTATAAYVKLLITYARVIK